MKQYLDIVKEILKHGVVKNNRTGITTLSIPGMMFKHDMADGFPLLTTKKVPFHLVASELEFFIKGKTDKKWLQDRNNHIWDEWCNPENVPYGHDDETKKKMHENRDLGPIYGWQWRNFGGEYKGCRTKVYGGKDQLLELLVKLKENPDDRRMIVNAWNPNDLGKMALPPCHYSFQVIVNNGVLNLLWNQRSVDVALGLPFNIASYGLLLHLLALESGFQEGKLIGFLGDTHIYTNHINGFIKQMSRFPRNLPTIATGDDFGHYSSLLEWEYTDSCIFGYNPYPSISFDIAV